MSWLITQNMPGPTGLAALASLIIGAVVYGALALGIGSLLYNWLWKRGSRLAVDASTPGSNTKLSSSRKREAGES
jgi:hypothetical protein